MAGSAAFDFVVKESLKKASSAAPPSEPKTGPRCNIKWNPTLDEIQEAGDDTQDFMDCLSHQEKATVNAWDNLLQSTSPCLRTQNSKLKALENVEQSKSKPLTLMMLDNIPNTAASSVLDDAAIGFDNATGEEKMPEAFQELRMPDAAGEKMVEASQELKMPDAAGDKMAEASQELKMPDATGEKMAEASQELKMPDAAGDKMAEASQELKMPDAAGDKMAEASQELKMPDATGEKMPEASQDQQMPGAEEKPQAASPEGDDSMKPEVPKSRKRPRHKGAEKVTFANRTRPKTPMMLNMWESTRVAFNEKIKSVILHPAKNEPEFYKYCVQSWMTPESMQEADFFQQALAMAEDWLKANQDKVVQK